MVVKILWNNTTSCKVLCNTCQVKPILKKNREIRTYRVNGVKISGQNIESSVFPNINIFLNGRRLRNNEYVYYYTTLNSGNYVEFFEKNVGNKVSYYQFEGTKLNKKNKCIRGKITLSHNSIYATLIRNGVVIKKNVLIKIKSVE